MLSSPSVPEPVDACEECERLFAHYAHAHAEYIRTIEVLEGHRDRLPADQFESLATCAREAEARSLEALAALNGHTLRHGCFKEL